MLQLLIFSEEEDLGDMDSLDIKPPQAKVQEHRPKKRETERSHHKRSDRSDKRREERHAHRDKHHR